MKKKVGTFKIWLLAIAAVVAFSVLPKVSSLATEDQALVVKRTSRRLLMRAMNRLQRISEKLLERDANLEAQGWNSGI